MKKLVLVLLCLLATTFITAQEQFRMVYDSSSINNSSVVGTGGTIIFNYGNERIVKLYADSVYTFTQKTVMEIGQTKSGFSYKGAVYVQEDNEKSVYIQLFDDVLYGCRFIFPDGNMINFY